MLAHRDRGRAAAHARIFSAHTHVSSMESPQPGHHLLCFIPSPPSPIPGLVPLSVRGFWGGWSLPAPRGVKKTPYFNRCVLCQYLFQLGFSGQANLAERRTGQESGRNGKQCLKCYPFSTALQKCFGENNSFELNISRGGMGEVEQFWSSCLEQLVRLFN